MSTRELLYFGSPENTELVPAIRSAGWQVHVARDTVEARQFIDRSNVRVGLAMLGNDGCVTRQLFELWPVTGHMEWVAMLDPACLNSAQYASLISEHFYDYHTLPADVNRLLFSLGHAWGMATMTRALHQEDLEKFSQYEMVGASPAMREVFRGIRKVANVDAPVLITGESGTGKELAAIALHERSARRNEPFVAVNCGALPPNLIHSELFGYEKGAFAGAVSRKIGHIEAAGGGTLFLDEVGGLPLELQASLVRLLQERTIERVGGTERIRVNVRVIAATNCDLERAVREDKFREDLYYRLHVLTLEMPPLRERKGDVELLAQFFFDKFVSEKRQNLRGFSQKALQCMQGYDWPGNVRELINRVRRAMVMSDRRLIMPEDLGLNGALSSQNAMTLDRARDEAERAVIRTTLQRARNNISRAARELGVSRVTLYRLMEKHRISPA
jgi:DNA-binding NtrC family response regulator